MIFTEVPSKSSVKIPSWYFLLIWESSLSARTRVFHLLMMSTSLLTGMLYFAVAVTGIFACLSNLLATLRFFFNFFFSSDLIWGKLVDSKYDFQRAYSPISSWDLNQSKIIKTLLFYFTYSHCQATVGRKWQSSLLQIRDLVFPNVFIRINKGVNIGKNSQVKPCQYVGWGFQANIQKYLIKNNTKLIVDKMCCNRTLATVWNKEKRTPQHTFIGT